MTATDAAVIPAGAATGIGSLPGTDPLEAARLVAGELEDLPHLVELPARGLGADLIGRTAGMLVDLPVDTSTTGYRLVDRPGPILGRARGHLVHDLDATEEVWEVTGLRGAGRTIKVQAAGPATLAAHLELPGGRKVLTDPGALAEVTESLAEGIAAHIREVTRRLGAAVVLQLDEPELPAVLGGTVPGLSRFDPVSALPAPDAAGLIRRIVEKAGAAVLVHCCAPAVPLEVLDQAGATGAAIDLAQVTAADLDAIGEWLEAGRLLAAGVVPTAPGRADPVTGTDPVGDPRSVADPVVHLIDRLGFPRTMLATGLLYTPACGLAGVDPDRARTVLDQITGLARAVRAGDFGR